MLDFANAYYTQYYSIIRNSNLDSGVIVTSVEKNSPAAKGGIEANDIIISIEGKEVSSTAYLKYYLYQYNIGDTIKIVVYRDGKEVTLNITLGSSGQTT